MRVSVVGLGTWQLGGEWGRDFGQADVDVILDRAAETGINLIDTAECYGDHLAERLVGDYLSRHDRDRWIVATKFGHGFNGFMDRTDRFRPEEVRDQLIASLRALRTDRIDVYQFHSGSDEAFLDDGLRTVLEEARRSGMVRNLGVSIRGAGSEVQARGAFGRGYGVLQVVYNRLDPRAESEVFPHARRYGLGILARVPLGSGLLSGKYDALDKFDAADYRSTLGKGRSRAASTKRTGSPARNSRSVFRGSAGPWPGACATRSWRRSSPGPSPRNRWPRTLRPRTCSPTGCPSPDHSQERRVFLGGGLTETH
jgi:aryl-alcohol dehydrogenase-like predicted oxidoreductase